MSRKNAAVFIFQDHRQVQNAISALREAGCDTQALSVVGKDRDGPGHSLIDDPGSKARRQTAEWVSFWCNMWNLLSGDAFLQVEGVGPILVAGPLAPIMIGALLILETPENLHPLGAGLRNVGIRRIDTSPFQSALQQSCYLVVVTGSNSEVKKAERILQSSTAAS
jgi:hypothetical protein